MTLDRLCLGRTGEEAAVKHLKKKGFRIVQRNFRCRIGELDIIAMDGPCLVFVEVRTKAGKAFGLPQESITPQKKHKLRLLASFYLQSNSIKDIPVRIDVIAVTVAPGDRIAKIEHIKNAL